MHINFIRRLDENDDGCGWNYNAYYYLAGQNDDDSF